MQHKFPLMSLARQLVQLPQDLLFISINVDLVNHSVRHKKAVTFSHDGSHEHD